MNALADAILLEAMFASWVPGLYGLKPVELEPARRLFVAKLNWLTR